MKYKIYLFVLLAFYFNNAFSTEELDIKEKRLTIVEGTNSNTTSDQINKLLSRIEILEHSVLRLQDQLEQLNRDSNKQTTETSNTQDVFDNIKTKQLDHKEDNVQNSDKSSSVKSEKRAYDIALAALKDNKLKEAEERFSDFIKNYPKSSMQSNAYFWHGEAFFKRKMFDQAAINYLKGYKQFPRGAKASDSLLRLALCLGELNKKKEACDMLERLEAEFPNRSSASIKRAADAKVSLGCKKLNK